MTRSISIVTTCIERLLISSTYYLYFFFFFSSRRRHTRLTCDWSSDVCSSDLTGALRDLQTTLPPRRRSCHATSSADRSEERRVGKSVDLGGRRIIKKKKKNK